MLTTGAGAYPAGGPSPGANASAFLARTSGLDTTHTNAYINLINGLDTDGLFSKLDFLHIYATQDSTTALLNLVSTNFNGTVHGAPTFTTDRGYTGVNASSTVYIDTGLNPTTATSPQFTQNSAHLSVWNLTNTTSGFPAIGLSSSSNDAYILTDFTDAHVYFRINATNTGGGGAGIADARGHFIGNRSGSAVQTGYVNGSNFESNTIASTAIFNGNFHTLGWNNNGTFSGNGNQSAMASAGSSLNSTDAANFYSRLRTYMTAVGVP